MKGGKEPGRASLLGTGRFQRVRKALVTVALILSPALAFALDPAALPTGGTVAAGSASISQTGPRLNVQQQSNRAILNWNTFNIGANASVNFQQPASTSVVLNRVSSGGGVSEIYGSLAANGQVFLVNPAGTLFGRGAQVNVGGLVAASLDITNQNFLNGIFRFAANGVAGSILNQGTLTAAEGGYIALLAPQVRNEGVVAARMGTVAFGAGEAVRLDINGTGLVEMQVEQAAVDVLIANRSLVQADGGVVLMGARAAGQLAAGVINNSGEIHAARVTERDGVIRLEAGDVANSGSIVADGANGGRVTLSSDKTTINSGSISARGSRGKGGAVGLLGDKVGLFGTGRIDATGEAGGGTVLVGGNYRGRGPEKKASRTVVDANAYINVSATGNGDGGKVIVWADDLARFSGAIEAKGGPRGGNGGFVETSGKDRLQAFGSVDASAPKGLGGTWLLDPNNITISGTTGSFTDGSFNSTDDNAVVNNVSLGSALANGTTVNVTTKSAGPNSQAGDIFVQAGVTASVTTGGTATLNLVAQRNIDFNASASLNGGTGKLNVNLNAGTDVGSTNTPGTNASAITMTMGSSIQTGGGNVTATAKSNGITLAGIDTGSGSLTVNSNGGAIGQATPLTVGGASSFSAGANTITLTNSTNNFGGAVSLFNSGANAVQITDTDALTLGTLSIPSGNLTVTSSGALNLGSGSIGGNLVANTNSSGAISQTGGLSVSGSSTITATGNSIALADASNDFAGSVTATGSNIELKDTNSLSAAITASGTGKLTAGGTLTVSGSTSGALTTTTTGTGTTTLSSLTVNSASITSAGAITMSGALDAGSGAVNLTSSGGAISESGSGKVGTSGALTTSSASGQTLSGANTVSTFNATNSSGNLSFTNAASALSITGINNTGTGNVTVNNTGVMSITGTVNAIGSGSNVNLTSSGQLSESGSGVVNAAGTLTTSSVGGLSMNGANTVGGFSATNTTSGNIAFTNTANGFNSAPTVAGVTTLTVGSIAQSGGGGINIANSGNLSTSGFISSSGGSISLTSTNGSQTIGGTGMNAGAGGVTLNATGSTGDITLNSTLNMGSFTANAGRDIVHNPGFTTSTGGFSATAGRDIRIQAAGTTAAMTASTMTLSAGGDLKIQGGTGTGALAYAYSNGTGAAQTISANTISIEGGSIGNGNYAGIFGRGPQSVTAPAGITLKGGASGGVSGVGNFAEISTTGNQTVTVGFGNLTAIGGGGATNTDNYARIYQYDSASTQTINLNHGGSIVLTGGSSGLSNVGGTGHGSRASIDTTGTSQSINFAAGGAINLTGGTVGSRAFALITSENGSQTIAGSPTITLTGGASGGVDGEGNYAEIFAKTGQTINASSILLTGGGAGIENGAGIVSDASQAIASGSMTLNAGAGGTKNAAYIQARTQNIKVHGNLSLSGGGSASSPTNGGGAGLGGRGAPNASPTDLVLTVDGDLTMAGGASGSAIGSGFIGGQTTDMTINVGGNVTLDPAIAGVRIGTPASNPAGGNISITAVGTLALNDTATAGTGILTLGNVTLRAASISGGSNGRSLISANTLTSTSVSGATAFNTLAVGSLSAMSSGALNLGQGVVNGVLVAVSNGKPITQAGPLTVAGTASITAGAAPITLTSANDFNGTVLLSNSGLNAVQVTDTNTITFSNMVLGGTLTVNAPTIIAHDTTTTGNQLWNGSVTFNSTETTNGGSFTVTGATTLGNGLTVNAGSGNVTFQGAVNGTQTLVVNSSGFTNFAGTVSSTVSLSVSGASNAPTATTQAVTSVVASTVSSLSTDAVSSSAASTSGTTSTSTTSAAAATVAAAAGPPPAPLTAATSTEAGTTRLTESSGVSKETIRQIDQQISQARTQMFSPALAQLASDPSVADVPECGAKGGAVCVKQGKPKKSASLAPDAEPVIKRRLAVLFGNDRYLAPIPALQTPVHDVEAIGKVLKDQLGYETRIINNASKEAIVNELNNLVTEVDEDDSVFVYYAGHGYQADKGGGGYWIPVDANNSDASSWISNGAISKFLANMASRQVMLVSDSCYSGTLAQEQKVSATESTVFDRKEILRKRSVLVMSSGGNEPVSDGGHEDHSLFAYHFLRNLKGIEADLVGSDIHARVHAAVTKEYPQDPQYGAVVSAGHAEGGEYLIMKR